MKIIFGLLIGLVVGVVIGILIMAIGIYFSIVGAINAIQTEDGPYLYLKLKRHPNSWLGKLKYVVLKTEVSPIKTVGNTRN